MINLVEFSNKLYDFPNMGEAYIEEDESNPLSVLLSKSQSYYFYWYDQIEERAFATIRGVYGSVVDRKAYIREKLKTFFDLASQRIKETIPNDYNAIDQFSQMFFDKKGNALYSATVKKIRPRCLYRVREAAKYEVYKQKDLFLIPPGMSKLVSKHRFNQDGYPCLYLASTLYSAWEEARRPDFDMMNFSLYKPQQDVYVLSIYIEPNMAELGDFIMAFFAMISCVKTNDRDKFHYQYVVPNLFMSIVAMQNKQRHKIDGIRYLSSRRFDGKGYNFKGREVDEAFVFLPSIDSDGCLQTGRLRRLFMMTDPKNYFFYKSNRSDFITTKARVSGYQETLFYALEELMQKEELKKIQDE